MACRLFGAKPLSKPYFDVKWALRKKRQWNFNRNIKLFIHENASENIVCEMAAILSRGRLVLISPEKKFSLVDRISSEKPVREHVRPVLTGVVFIIGCSFPWTNGRIRLSISTASRTYELWEETHVTPFRTYIFHSTELCNYKTQEQTYRTSCRYGLTVRNYWARSNVFRTYGTLSRGLFLRVCIGTVYCTYGQSNTTNLSHCKL